VEARQGGGIRGDDVEGKLDEVEVEEIQKEGEAKVVWREREEKLRANNLLSATVWACNGLDHQVQSFNSKGSSNSVT